MNTSSRKVLREVFLGILIMELNRRKDWIRRRRCPRMKKVSGWSKLTFWCHWRTNVNRRVRERERGRKRKLEKSQAIQIYHNILKRKNVCMEMHEHVTYNRKIIMGSAQSKPTSTQANNRYSTHLNAWKYSYNVHEMQCMKFLRSNLQKSSQKFHKNLFDFEKPQIL